MAESSERSISVVLGSDGPVWATFDGDEAILDEVPPALVTDPGEARAVALTWPLVIGLLDWTTADDARRARQIVDSLPIQLSLEQLELLADLVVKAELPGVTRLRLRPDVRGTAGSERYAIRPRWLDEEGRRIQTAPRREGGILVHPDGGQERTTLGQLKALHLLDGERVPTGDRDADLRFQAEVVAAIPLGDPGVELSRVLTTPRTRSVGAVAPRIEREGGRFRVLPRVREIKQGELDKHFEQTPLGRIGDDRLETRGPDGQLTRYVFQSRAKAGLTTLKAQPPLESEEVAEALTNPERFFGPNLDTSELSERVTGLGPPIRRVFPTLREIPAGEWWDWDIEAEEASVDDGAEQVEKEGDDSSIRLKDEGVLTTVERAIAEADRRGSGYIPHPNADGRFLELDRSLRDMVSQARTLVDAAKKNGGKLPKPVRQVLQVAENVENVAFDRTERAPLPEIEAVPPPASLRRTFNLKPHQEEGYRWLVSLFGGASRKNKEGWSGALLADDMGLGKTLQVLAYLAWAKERGLMGPHLVVAPVSLLENWQQEAHRFFGGALEPVLQVNANTLPDEVDRARPRLENQFLVLVSYETLRRREAAFAPILFSTIILDEAQKAKDPTSQISRVVRTLRAQCRLCMTGTPVENSLKELWNLVDWARPGYLGSLKSFGDSYIKPLRDNLDGPIAKEVANRLKEHIQPIFLRRMKYEVLPELPPLERRSLDVPLGPQQSESYTRLIKSEGKTLGKLIQLLGVCAHPELETNRSKLSPLSELSFPKAERLFEILSHIRESDEKVILFANRRAVQNWLAQEIRLSFDVPVDIINGQINDSKARMRNIKKFSEREGFAAIVLAPRAAGVGLNITAANHVIHYMREWNPAIENQATDRAYRIGQTRPVFVYTLTTSSPSGFTVEQRLDSLLEKKRNLMRQFVVPMGATGVSPEELLAEGDL